MAYSGWLSYAGVELVNEARTRAYVTELLPGLSMPVDCRDSADLAETLGDNPYSTPAIDDAPWFDPDDGDTGGFCGFFPLSVSGLTDSTREATVVESTTSGGSVTGLRRTTREVRVTGLLIGVDTAAVAAGKTWLKAALDGACGDPCQPADLCFLAAAPNLDVAMGDYTTEIVPRGLLQGPSGRWNPVSGAFTPLSSGQPLTTPPAPTPLPCDEIIWHWSVQGDVGTEVVLETLGETGITTAETFILSGSVQPLTVSDKAQSLRLSRARLRVLTPGEAVTVKDVSMEFRLPGDPDVCFEKYLRQLRDVTCIDGPRTTREYAPSDGAMERVEFSFVAGVPWVYGIERKVVSVRGTKVNTSVPNSTAYNMASTVPVCAAKRAPSIVVDPDCPPVPAPPRSAVPVAGCGVEPSWYEPYAVYIPQDVIPLWSDTVPIVGLTTGNRAARKVVVRFLPRPLDAQRPEDLDPCSACGSFVIDYIPPNATFLLNGMEERAYIQQPGGVVTSGDHLLSGPVADELFEWPLLSCGSGYYMILDVAATTGLAGIDLSIVVRE